MIRHNKTATDLKASFMTQFECREIRKPFSGYCVTTVFFAILIIAGSCAMAENWDFSRKKDPRANKLDLPTKKTVVRGQYSSSVGRTVPTLSDNKNEPVYTAPVYTAPANTTSSTTAYSPATSTSGSMQSAPVSPQVGQQNDPFPWLPGTGPPTLTGDAAGQGPYMPERGVIDGLDRAGVIAPPAYMEDPARYLPLQPIVTETQTGRLMFSVGVNSDAGLLGSVIIDEQNFDWARFPTSWEQVRTMTAWRGGGQRLRIEATPGTEVQRYIVQFQEPYLLNSRVSLGLSANYFTRYYESWNEDRVGGRISLGYRLTPDLTGSLAFRGEKIGVFDIPTIAPQELIDAYGNSGLYGFSGRLAHDTRDNSFCATEGHLIEASVEQVIGSYQYPRFEVDLRRYFTLHERADGSGRHVLSTNVRFAWTGEDTPIYDHYFAGGFSTLRGFDFRGASPRDPASGVFVGGEMMFLASAEYRFPITADDMISGVVFCDTGTVEPTISDWTDTYRVSPGFGLRIKVPAMGPAPIALDFAFPISKEKSDWTEVFSFYVGFGRF
jgi:outer membrane protein insertion porin family